MVMVQTYDALTLTNKSTIQLTGKTVALPAGKSAPDGHELHADWWTVVGKAPGDSQAFKNQISEESGLDTLSNGCHLVLRGETSSGILKVCSAMLDAFRESYNKLSIIEVTPPCMVQTQVETHRHLSEYKHLEAELGFISFEELLAHIEELICSTLETLMKKHKIKALIQTLNTNFLLPAQPFRQMDYKDALMRLFSSTFILTNSLLRLATLMPSDLSVSYQNWPALDLIQRLKKMHIQKKLQLLSDKTGNLAEIDYSMAEALAFGTILEDGYDIRLSGQDSGQGVFSQRHALLTDQMVEGRKNNCTIESAFS
ncbi:hypothetical protein PPACK8108_LOCUS2470 [Phakopsora pachyrhizi]|uniref:Aminoacyl-tRNA synthetase class II (D/K/N) domain-containing protein n=1 Tax=Phakopsora pachyrhizi TaxID=170000 RepID=A0AAV0AHZ5_PHAPC|nr:hypothetical protein PPACK8108_LOCUS2470 [Phakopsora pachyrhizi]